MAAQDILDEADEDSVQGKKYRKASFEDNTSNQYSFNDGIRDIADFGIQYLPPKYKLAGEIAKKWLEFATDPNLQNFQIIDSGLIEALLP